MQTQKTPRQYKVRDRKRTTHARRNTLNRKAERAMKTELRQAR
jgi:hypothetical protein